MLQRVVGKHIVRTSGTGPGHTTRNLFAGGRRTDSLQMRTRGEFTARDRRTVYSWRQSNNLQLGTSGSSYRRTDRNFFRKKMDKDFYEKTDKDLYKKTDGSFYKKQTDISSKDRTNISTKI